MIKHQRDLISVEAPPVLNTHGVGPLCVAGTVNSQLRQMAYS